MKQILIIATVLLTLNSFGQTKDEKVNEPMTANKQSISVNDTVPKVSYVNKNLTARNPVYYLNGQLVSAGFLTTMDPQNIDSINVVKKPIEVNNDQYYGQIYIKTKASYHPKLISLNDLKSKYTNLNKASTIFLIDNQVINGEYDKYLVDEKYIFQIIVEKVESKAENLEFNLVKLLTRTEENIKKSKEIRLRGTEEIE
ncbi:MAG: hypothetical protein NTY07_09855 [Bacteroidia bacterium]|nr:hypothetical protein [Bacteroidia bacterium]